VYEGCGGRGMGPTAACSSGADRTRTARRPRALGAMKGSAPVTSPKSKTFGDAGGKKHTTVRGGMGDGNSPVGITIADHVDTNNICTHDVYPPP